MNFKEIFLAEDDKSKVPDLWDNKALKKDLDVVAKKFKMKTSGMKGETVWVNFAAANGGDQAFDFCDSKELADCLKKHGLKYYDNDVDSRRRKGEDSFHLILRKK